MSNKNVLVILYIATCVSYETGPSGGNTKNNQVGLAIVTLQEHRWIFLNGAISQCKHSVKQQPTKLWLCDPTVGGKLARVYKYNKLVLQADTWEFLCFVPCRPAPNAVWLFFQNKKK